MSATDWRAISAAVAAARAAKCEAAAVDDERCLHCGGVMDRSISDLGRICAECGLLTDDDAAEPEDDAPRAVSDAARLRIVGPGSGHLQPDLYRSGAGSTPATQIKQVYEEICVYRQYHIEGGGRAFPLDTCQQAADNYNVIQRQMVKRSMNKKRILAALIHFAGLNHGFAPTKSEIAELTQLNSRGIAVGINFVRMLVADGRIDLDINVDACRPEISTLFAKLGLPGSEFRPAGAFAAFAAGPWAPAGPRLAGAAADLREVVYDVVQMAIRENIGTSSILRSKVAGATFAVLSRRPDAPPISLREFCSAGGIRENTIDRFVRELDAHSTFFGDIYATAGLLPKSKPPPAPAHKPARKSRATVVV